MFLLLFGKDAVIILKMVLTGDNHIGHEAGNCRSVVEMFLWDTKRGMGGTTTAYTWIQIMLSEVSRS